MKMIYANFLILIIPISFYLVICKYNGIKFSNMFSVNTIEKFLNENNKLAIATILMMALSAALTFLILSFMGLSNIKNLR
ncbi:hypothetical protein FDA33_10025 [Clostridium botulinum]|uniref:Uncharacterized protein n=1 Tax=Clostridium botulinum TaxID=1491 RepID=A0A846JV26_CLOBO|nr:hypothetical protein [Clostridium botulinum]NFH90529.1 hypothetical protein [Clostridium botulinum]NFI17213.1 hypothetical protein [Clostridium botulinum]NFN19454.1 hypothetical protein [Clostridium botulinum]NFN36839.1 hypothetical protein [Clostridium botulinum]NFN53008.1 hypothetical protein [Clostridium botulinum]